MEKTLSKLSEMKLSKITLLTTIIVSLFSMLIVSLIDIITGDFSSFIPNIVFSLIIGSKFGILVNFATKQSRISNKMFEKFNPIKEGSENCKTMVEWEVVKFDLNDFMNNNKLNSLWHKRCEEVLNILRVKKEFMK